MGDTFDDWSLANNSHFSAEPQDNQAQPWDCASYPQDPTFDLFAGLDASSISNTLEYGVPLPIPAQTGLEYASGSDSIHHANLTQFPQYTTSQQAASQSNLYSSNAQIQLEILRETRRIRELELTIAGEKRRSDEAIMHQREAEVALAKFAHTPLHDESESPNSGSIPDIVVTPDSWPFSSFPSLFDYDSTDLSTMASPSSDLSMDITPDTPHAVLFPNIDPGHLAGSQTPYTFTSSTPPPIIPPSALPSLTSNRRRKLGKKDGTVVEERMICCTRCSKPMVKALLRGTRSELDAQFRPQFQCKDCAPVRQATGTSKKRGNELEDTALPTLCVVCTKPQGEGGFVSKDRTPLAFMCEVSCPPRQQEQRTKVFASAFVFSTPDRLYLMLAKIQTVNLFTANPFHLASYHPSIVHRILSCSHCGGGTGRVAHGKWRCKELFEGDRKTCSLSHEK